MLHLLVPLSSPCIVGLSISCIQFTHYYITYFILTKMGEISETSWYAWFYSFSQTINFNKIYSTTESTQQTTYYIKNVTQHIIKYKSHTKYYKIHSSHQVYQNKHHIPHITFHIHKSQTKHHTPHITQFTSHKTHDNLSHNTHHTLITSRLTAVFRHRIV